MNFLILDGNSILNRAFYAIKLLTTKDGRYTNAIYGFMKILLRLTDEVKPEYVAITFDRREPTFRHTMYSEYKAGRKPMPSELAEQMPVLKELLEALGYRIITKAGYEADDLIGTLSLNCGEGNKAFIATGDRDSLQLIMDNVNVLLASTKMGRAETTLYDAQKLKEEYGVSPEQMKDIKALMGDTSDNIPGIPGVGKKTAEDLIKKFGTVDYIYNNIDTIDVRETLRKKLKDNKESAYLSYKLGTIDRYVPIETDIEFYKKMPADSEKAFKILNSLEMYKIIEQLELDTPIGNSENSFTCVTEKAEIKLDGMAEIISTAEQEKNIYFNTVFDSNGEISAIYVAEHSCIYKLTKNDEFNAFKEILKDNGIKKYTYDAKSLYSYHMKKGDKTADTEFDLMLAAYLLNPSAKDYGIEQIAREYSVPRADYELDEEKNISCFRVLCDKLEIELDRVGQKKLFDEIEMPLAKVLASMEVYGVEVDKEGIEDFSIEISNKISQLEEKIYSLAGEKFNINSPKQLGEVLFEKLQLPVKTKKKTKTGYSTNAEVLEELAGEYEIVKLIIDYREFSKLKSTYCDGLLKAISQDGRIHSNFNQTETRTGRISSTEPNLQNIPVRTENGAKMRKFFVAKAGYTFIDADYSQIELRVLCDMANDQNMIDDFNSGIDIHTVTASQVFKMPVEMVTPLMRKRAKAVNFGIVYGIGAFSLGKDIGVPRAEADRYIKDYLHHYSGVEEYMKDVVQQAKKDGYASTLFGRRRYLPELSASNGMIRAFGERVARNMPIQGTAADIIKIAMIRVYERLNTEKLDARLILQVHDELIVEARVEAAEEVKKIVTEEMENAAQMKVKLLSDANIGKTWYDAKG